MPEPKPDDRSDNVEKLQHHLQHTQENLEQAEDFVKAHDESIGDPETSEIEAKNRRRRDAIRGFRDEIEDEAHKDS